MTASLTIGVMGVIFSLAGGMLSDRYDIKLVAIVARLVVTALLYPALVLVVSDNGPGIPPADIEGADPFGSVKLMGA